MERNLNSTIKIHVYTNLNKRWNCNVSVEVRGDCLTIKEKKKKIEDSLQLKKIPPFFRQKNPTKYCLYSPIVLQIKLKDSFINYTYNTYVPFVFVKLKLKLSFESISINFFTSPMWISLWFVSISNCLATYYIPIRSPFVLHEMREKEQNQSKGESFPGVALFPVNKKLLVCGCRST